MDNFGILVKYRNGSESYFWYPTEGQRNSKYNAFNKEKKDPKGKIKNVLKKKR